MPIFGLVFLLGAKKFGVIDQATTVAFRSDVELIVPLEVIEELRAAAGKSAYLARHIPKSNVDTLIERFYISATVGPVLSQQSKFTRDPKDDYLIIYSLAHAVDYLVTGDQDLLVLDKVEHPQIVTPNQFLEILG